MTEKMAAKAGAKWLDKNNPVWVEKIDLRTLRMDHGGFCILGQCYGGYFDALNSLKPNDADHDERWARAHGFNCLLTSAGRDKNGSYERLALAWAPLVAVRQVAGKSGG